MKITEIYQKYKIMPSLQLHMYRVASVASTISDVIKEDHKRNDITTACLLHDMGNILKFNLDLFPEFLAPEGKEYWQQVKDTFHRTYGDDEHQATLQIVKELHMSDRIYELVDAFSFTSAGKNYMSNDFDRMICTYSDMRVEPHGVVTLGKRLEDGKKRFRINKPGQSSEEVFVEMSGFLHKIEDRLFHNLGIKPDDITENCLSKYLPILQEQKV